jgi:hypothetical protein
MGRVSSLGRLDSAPLNVVDVVQASAALRAALALGGAGPEGRAGLEGTESSRPHPADVDALALEAVLLSAADSDRHGAVGFGTGAEGARGEARSPPLGAGSGRASEEQEEEGWRERFGVLATAARALQAAVAQAKTEAAGDADFAAAELEARAEEDQAAARVAEARLAQSLAACRAAEDSTLEAAEEAAAASLRADRAEHRVTGLIAELERERGRVAAAEARARGAETETHALAGQLDELVGCLDELCESLVAGAVRDSGTRDEPSGGGPAGASTSSDVQAVVKHLLHTRVPTIADLIRNGALATAREARNREELSAALASVRTAAALGASLSLGGE